MKTGPADCAVVVRATDRRSGTEDTTSYYNIWEAFMAVRAVCIRNNRVGTFSGLGKPVLRWRRCCMRFYCKSNLTAIVGENGQLTIEVKPSIRCGDTILEDC